MKTVKTSLLFLILTYSGLLFGQVGINTTTPRATLDIAGVPSDLNTADGLITPRVTGDQLKNKDNVYTAAQDGALVYVTQALTSTTTSNRTKDVLAKGYYSFDSSKGANGQWVRIFHTPPAILAGGVTGNHHPGPALFLQSRNGTLATGTLESRTITLTEKSIVTINVSVPVTDVRNYNAATLTDGASKGYGASVFITGGGFTNYRFTRSGATFSNSGNFYANGVFQVGATRSLTLNPGTYTFDLGVYLFARDATGVSANTGTTSQDTVFDIISSPLLE